MGAGFGGVAAAIELRRHGIEHVRILEAADAPGGTWFYNSYPGAACDVPSHLYSFSYEQRRDWSRLCSTQAEILRYLQRVADDHDVTPLVETGRRVSECRFDVSSARWRVQAFIEDMPAAFAQADLVLSRSGASTVAELADGVEKKILTSAV